ncbi:MAG TPA: ATP-binding cassette domain-containing protein [Bacteroidia bacterium]|jgi:phospholipid/cholesterol/gamma-HCH transport system ATP-binding protein|nr:ATP-binding cassette domain-containing protein [Bacteroidia bacterium]
METNPDNKPDSINPGNTSNGGDYVVVVEHLKKSFDDRCILKDINLKLAKGENLVVLGKSGTGKSVLIKCIVRLLEADGGTISVFGKNIAELEAKDLNELRKKIGFLFQSAALYDSMSVRENLEFSIRELQAKKSDEIDSRVKEALQNVNLLDAIDAMPSDLSGGMRKRVGLARTLILKPEIILYDEPTTGLDPITSREISNLIVEVQQKYNAASLIITHDIACAKTIADRVMLINEGICVAEGTFDELQKSSNSLVQSFFKQ